MKKRFSIKNNLLDVIICAVLIVYVISFVLPLGWGFLTAFKTNRNFIEKPLGFPNPIEFSNFGEVVMKLSIEIPVKDGTKEVFFENMLLNSVIFSFGLAFVSTFVPMVVSYAVAKYPYRLSKWIYSVVIVTMILPIVGSLPSEINMLRTLGLYDKFMGIILMKCNFLGMYFLIFYAMYKSIPWAYAESAFIDGAGHFSVFLAIYMPLVQTTFFSVYLLNFITYWNDYMTNAMYLPSMPTLAFGIHAKQFSGGLFSKPTMQLTTSIILAVPLIALFAAFQKRLMGSLTIGGIKG